MYTREMLVSLRATTKLLTQKKRFPEIAASSLAVDALGAALAAPAEPRGPALDALYERLVRAFSGVATSSVPKRDLREAPWILWRADKPLSRVSGALDAVCAEASRSAAVRRNLIEAWVRYYDPTDRTHSSVGGRIQQIIESSTDRRLDIWKHASRKARLFDGSTGPRLFARWLIAGPELVSEILEKTGFDDPLRAVSEYMRAVQREVLLASSDVVREGDAPTRLSRILDFIAPENSLRFPEQKARGELARLLLDPWVQNQKNLSESARISIQSFLLSHIGDPRLHPARWTDAGAPAMELMRRWLTRASLDAFFELISEYALDDHWRYRKAFWSACLERDEAADAWLALGSRIFASARAVRELQGSYAKLEGPGVGGDQAILLLRIRDHIFCEWSHNGKLRAWPAEWKNAPQFRLPSYTRAQITGKGLPFPANPRFGSRGAMDGSGLSHVGSDRDYWQGSAAELLFRRTRIQLSPNDWRP